MSYATAYTSHFRSLDNTLWGIEILIDDYVGRPLEIKLEGDEPCVIEWPETDKMDVVQSSTCTLRVSNESDRQMVQLMDHPDAAIVVKRDGKEYWFGLLDDAVYEEPYSFTNAYVTEIVFSDFGKLNRIPFTLSGKQSVSDIVHDCLNSIRPFNNTYVLYTSLLDTYTQQPISLANIYINADRFLPDGDGWDAMTDKHTVLEEVLRPFGLRIMQKNSSIYIYDIEYLRDHIGMQSLITWKGTDAYLKGSETYGRFEEAFDVDAEEVLAEDGLNYDDERWIDGERYFANCYNQYSQDDRDIGFYIEIKEFLNSAVHISPAARFFRTCAVYAGSDEIGVAWRIACKQKLYNILNGSNYGIISVDSVPVNNLLSASRLIAWVTEVMHIDSSYIPYTPDYDKFQLRVNLDFLLSFRPNPFDNPPDAWVEQQDWWRYEDGLNRNPYIYVYCIPVKLELLDENGNILYHYKNAEILTEQASAPWYQYDYYTYHKNNDNTAIIPGEWLPGSGTFGDMCLAYFKGNVDRDCDPVITSGFVTNRQFHWSANMGRDRNDGEYVPMPPTAGRIRLTVGSGIFTCRYTGSYRLYNYIYYDSPEFHWQLYRNPKITLVRANRKKDDINTDTQYERESPRPTLDRFSETLMAGCWNKGIAPSARGLLFDAYGTVFNKFIKNGQQHTLAKHRLRSLEDQTVHAQPVLSGTAVLDIYFKAKTEVSTPGVFLITALRQDLHQDTEEVTMARIANVGGYVYDYAWDDHLCVEGREYDYSWDKQICVEEPEPTYSFEWVKEICAIVEIKV